MPPSRSLNSMARVLRHGVASGLIAMGPLLSAQGSAHQLKDPNGQVGCVVTAPATRSKTPEADLVTVDLRAPGPPGPTFLARLPVNQRDYSTRPIRVFLVALPDPGERVGVRLPQLPPFTTDFTPRRLGVHATAASDLFVRVAFPRVALKAGAEVVAERTATTDSGERITTQTRCRITPADTAVWR